MNTRYLSFRELFLDGLERRFEEPSVSLIFGSLEIF
jgi:hypothetical protein